MDGREADKTIKISWFLRPLPSLEQGIDWAIVGGESGPGARPMREEWVIEIQKKCQREEVPFFFKQWSGVCTKAAGRELFGRTWDELPLSKGA